MIRRNLVSIALHCESDGVDREAAKGMKDSRVRLSLRP